METIRSFKGYGKVNVAEDIAFRRKTRKRLIIISVSVVLVLVFATLAAVLLLTRHSNSNSSTATDSTSPSVSNSIKALCAVTLHPTSCFSTLSSAADPSSNPTPQDLFKLSLQLASSELGSLRDVPESLSGRINNKRLQAAVQICRDLVDDSVEQLNDSVDLLQDKTVPTKSKIEDLKTYLSGALTNQETCLDAFDETGGFRRDLESAFRNATELTSNSLAIATKLLGVLERVDISIHGRKLLGYERRLEEVSLAGLTPNLTVAADGSGNFTTISEALALVPKKNAALFVIRVKAGKYIENVFVDKKKWNVVMIGDGKDRSIVSGSLNFVDGTPTFNTATFIVEGRGFTAMDMGFENTAGPAKHQAVALRAKADHVVFYRCSFDAYQDTLYPHSLRQFYRECDVTGTIDFIFGDAAVIFQKCNIMPRQPMSNQFNTITAQGKKDPNENTGIVMEDCTISPFDKVTARTYLGRPWKQFSTTIVKSTVIGDVVNPKGWLSWDGRMDPPETIFYGEFGNSGPSSGTEARVTWVGYKPTLTPEELQKFSAGPFIQADEWLPTTGVSYTS